MCCSVWRTATQGVTIEGMGGDGVRTVTQTHLEVDAYTDLTKENSI